MSRPPREMAPRHPRTPQGFGIELDGLRAQLAVDDAVVGEVALPEGTVAAGDVLDVPALAAALRQLVSGVRLPRVGRVALPSPRLLSRTVHLPVVLPAEDLDPAVRFAAADVLPVALDDAVLVHAPVAEGPDGQRVLVAAVERRRVAALEEALAAAGLRGVAVDAGPAALAAGREAVAPGACELVVCAGGLTSVVVRQGGACAFFRTAASGVEPLVGKVVGDLGMDAASARRWLASLDSPPDGADPALLTALTAFVREAAAQVAAEAEASLDFHLRAGATRPVERVVLCGEGAAWPGLADRLGADLALPVEVLAGPGAVARALTAGAGPELARVARSRRPEGPRRLTGPVAVGAAALVAVAAVATAVAGNRVEDRRAQVAAADARIGALEAEQLRLAPVAQLVARKASREGAVRAALDARFSWDAPLRGLSWAATPAVRLVSVRGTSSSAVTLGQRGGATGGGSVRAERTGPALEVSGCATGTRAVAGFVARLERVDGVTAVAVDRTARRTGARDPDCDGVAFGTVAFLEGEATAVGGPSALTTGAAPGGSAVGGVASGGAASGGAGAGGAASGGAASGGATPGGASSTASSSPSTRSTP